MLNIRGIKNQLLEFNLVLNSAQVVNKINYYLKKYDIAKKSVVKSYLFSGAHNVLYCKIITNVEECNIFIENL